MKRTIIYLILLLPFSAFGQNPADIIFRAMETEAIRAKDSLKMGDVPNPFFISYSVTDKELLEVQSVLGTIVYSRYSPKFRNISVKPLVGDYKTTNVINFSNDMSNSRASAEDNEKQLRRDLWFATDASYKEAAASYRQKTASSKFKKNFDDYISVNPFTKLTVDSKRQKLDKMRWENQTKELSAMFKKYPEVISSSVNYRGSNTQYYYYNTDGAKFISPLTLSVLTVTASVRDIDGQIHKDKIEFIAVSDEYLPEISEMKSDAEQMVLSLMELAEASDIKEYYSGPVLFEDQAVLKLFMENLVMKNGIIAKRDNINLNRGAARITKIDKSLVSRMGKKLIDQKITIRDASNRSHFGGIPVPGFTEVDAEGITKNGEVTLIENGLLKRMISGRMPADSGMMPTGNLRFGALERGVSYSMIPTLLYITANKGKTPSQLKKELLKGAASEGLEYAYIIRRYPELRDDISARVYRVDVKSGKEYPVKAATILTIMNTTVLKRIRAVSSREQSVTKLYENYPITVSLPRALILDDIELNLLNYNKENRLLISNPLQRL